MALPSSMKAFDVAVVGEMYIDHIFTGLESWPRPGEEVLSRGYLREPGGGSVNTACGLARLGRRVLLFGLVGAVDLPWFTSRLNQFGVSTQGLRPHEAGTGVTASASMADDRGFFTYKGANAYLASVLTDEDVIASLCSARHVHIAMPLERGLARRLLPRLKHAGCTTSLDVGFSPEWLDDVTNRDTCLEVDYFLPNQKECGLLLGSEQDDAFAAFVREEGLGHGALKLGAAGALGVDRERSWRVKPPRVEVRDTTGAGDAFDAGFIDALLDKRDLNTCLERACICGALCATEAGALAGLPDIHQLGSFHEQTYGG
jgi:ribokinase